MILLNNIRDYMIMELRYWDERAYPGPAQASLLAPFCSGRTQLHFGALPTRFNQNFSI